MGVKGFPKIFKEFCVEKDGLSSYQGKKIAVDISIFLYRFKYNSKNDDVFIKRFELQLKDFRKYSIEPVYIFDGKPPKEKKNTLEKRKQRKEKNDNSIVITQNDIKIIKDLLDKNSILYYCPVEIEGEAFCSLLNKNGIVDLVMSNDYDSIIFGCNKLLITLGSNKYLELSIEDILINLKISLEQLTEACIASGTDYHPGLYRIGPKKALVLAHKYNKIENWGISIPENLELGNIRNIFLNKETNEKVYQDYIDCVEIISSKNK